MAMTEELGEHFAASTAQQRSSMRCSAGDLGTARGGARRGVLINSQRRREATARCRHRRRLVQRSRQLGGGRGTKEGARGRQHTMAEEESSGASSTRRARPNREEQEDEDLVHRRGRRHGDHKPGDDTEAEEGKREGEVRSSTEGRNGGGGGERLRPASTSGEADQRRAQQLERGSLAPFSHAAEEEEEK